MQPAEFRPAQNYDTNPYYDNAEWPGPGYVTIEPLSATENKTYTAEEGKAYSPVTVNVPFVVEPLTVTENDTYTAEEGKAYSPVTVNVSGGVSSYSIYCMVNDESAPSFVYPAKATDEGNWEQDGNSALDEAYAGQMLYIPHGFNISLASYFSDPFPDYPEKIPYSNTIADNSGCVFTMPAHDIGIMASVESPL